jgi:phospholipase C
MTWSRRQFLKSTASVAGGLYAAKGYAAKNPPGPLPLPGESGLDHIIVLMMENRSFDHFFGWIPGADGRQAGLTYFDNANLPHRTHHLTDYQGCGHVDPDHSYAGGRIEYNNGACDGWLRANNDEYAIGYYTQSDFAFYGDAAMHWTVFDRYFSATMAGTFPNKIYQYAAQTDRAANTFELCELPTILDLLIKAGRSARYYFNDVPFLALWGLKYLPISRPYPSFLADCASGNLPDVAFVDPRFLGEAQGVSVDDHPFADIRNGQFFIDQVYRAVTKSPAWGSTALIINYDEWGGFYDHVPPAEAPDVNPAFALRGFRIPAMMIAPWARTNQVSSEIYDHTSVLKMIEWRWGLPPLSVRDLHANNIAEALDFAKPKRNAPSYAVPAGPFGGPCAVPGAPSKFETLLSVARNLGWPAL